MLNNGRASGICFNGGGVWRECFLKQVEKVTLLKKFRDITPSMSNHIWDTGDFASQVTSNPVGDQVSSINYIYLVFRMHFQKLIDNLRNGVLLIWNMPRKCFFYFVEGDTGNLVDMRIAAFDSVLFFYRVAVTDYMDL